MLIFVLIVAYIWFLRFYFRPFWIAIFTLIFVSHLWRKETFGYLGFRWTNFEKNLREYCPFLLFLMFILIALGILFRTVRNVSVESGLSSLVFYCLWGLFQQYLLNGYFVNRFQEFSPGPEFNRAPILAAVFFSAAHLPNWFLMIVTFLGGYVSAKIYLKDRNLYFLGLAHGLIGFLLYLVVPDSISHHLYVGPKWFSF